MSSGPGGRPKRSLGQNFLTDGNVQRKIVDAIDPRPTQTLLEIGPGREALTRHLVDTAGRLVLVELDDELAAALAERYGGRPDVRVVHGDVLEMDVGSLGAAEDFDPAELRVVGNIPYNITTPILFHFLRRPRPRDLHLMVQKEVAERVVAEPGTSEYGALSVGVRLVAEAEKLFDVSRNCFTPTPNVDSAVLRIEPHAPPRLDAQTESEVRRVVRAAFQWRRKQLQKILRSHPELAFADGRAEAALARVGVDPRARPETLGPDDFLALTRALVKD